MHGLSRRQWLHLSGLASLGALVPSTATPLWAIEPKIKPSTNGVTDEEEIALGRKFAAQVEESLEITHNGVIDAYLGGIVRRLAAQSQRPNLPYSVKLVNSKDVNAFSLAGGFLYLHRGLAELMTSEDELVATLGHELGHVVGRHSINEIARNFAARRVLETVLKNVFKTNGVVEHIFAQFGGAIAILALLHFSREDELQADLLGFYEMGRAGYDPNGFLKLFATLEQVEGRGLHFPYMSTHPPTPQRVSAIHRELAAVKLPPGLKTDSISFHGFKALLSTLPAPPPPKQPQPGQPRPQQPQQQQPGQER